jgi:hypothetical protein
LAGLASVIYFALFFVYFLGHGAYFSAMSPHVMGRFPASADHINMVAQLASPIGTLLAGYVSDRTRLLRLPLMLSLVGFGISQIAFFQDLPETGIYVSTVLLRIFLSASGQLIIISCLEGAGSGRFARARTAGTVGFLVIQLSLYGVQSFWTETADPALLARWAAGFHFLTALLAMAVPAQRKSHEEYHFRAAAEKLTEPRVLLFFAGSFVFYGCYQFVDYYLGRFLQLRGGMGQVYLGWGFSVLFEIALMPFTALIFQKLSGRFLFLVSLAAGLGRFIWLYLAVDTNGPPAYLSQILHGLHFTGFYAAAIYLLQRIFPPHLYGTGHALYSVLAASAGGITGNLLTGLALGHGPGIEQFAPVFVISAALHCLLLLVFLFAPMPQDTRLSAMSYASK